MNENFLNWLAGGVVALWVVGACVRPLTGNRPQFQAFSQSLSAQTQQKTLVKQPVKKQTAYRPRYNR